jgi:hypothetical protein
MSGAVAAHNAYNGVGTQGLATTNKINDTGYTTSVFWNKNDTTRQLLHGSSYVEVSSSNPNVKRNDFGTSRIFTLNNDIDILSDIFLDIDFALDLSATPISTLGNNHGSANFMRMLDFEMQPSFAYQVIDRVEFMVGTQIWHTLTGDDIRVLNYTSRTESANYTHGQSLTSERFFSGTNVSGTGIPVDASSLSMGPLSTLIGEPLRSEIVRTIVWIPALSSNVHENMTSFANPSENGYLMAAAPQQSVQIKVTFKSNSIPGYIDSSFLFVASSFAVAEVGAGAAPTTYPILRANTVTTIQHTGVNAGTVIFQSGNIAPIHYPFKLMIFDPSGTFRSQLDQSRQAGGRGISVRTSISSVRMFAKQIMLCKEERDQIRNIPNGLPYRVKMSQSVRAALPTTNEVTIDLDSFSLYASHLLISVDMSTNSMVRDVELKLNNSSFSGALPFSLLTNNMAEALHVNTPPSIINGHVSYETRFAYFDSTAMDASMAPTGEHPMLVFPLAATAYSGSGVPLNRFDSIRLTIRFTRTPTSLPIYAFSGKTSGITVTCVGETTVLYKGGEATLAMY